MTPEQPIGCGTQLAG